MLTRPSVWLFLIFLVTCSELEQAKDGYPESYGPEDDEQDILPWPCPSDMTWHRCSVNLTCFDDSDEEAIASCLPGCYCPKRRFLLKGRCITKDECPPLDCTDDMEFLECGNYCYNTCPGALPNGACISKVCYDGCFCTNGKKRYAGVCYEPEDCPKEPSIDMTNFLLFNTHNPSPEEIRGKTRFLKELPVH